MEHQISKEYLADLPDDLLSSQANIYVANFIIHEATQVYYKNYKKRWIPADFLEFYFEEYKAYAHKSTYLLRFFQKYKVEDLPEILFIYRGLLYSILDKKKMIDGKPYYKIVKNKYLNYDLITVGNSTIIDPEILTTLANCSKHLANSDENVDIIGKYEYFMIQKVVKDKFSGKKTPIKSNTRNLSKEELSNVSPAQAQPEKKEENPMLVGKMGEIPNQKGKVTKLFFPKFNLPTPYPTTGKDSRINSNYRSRKFMTPSKQLQLINKKKIVGVRYSTFFIEKRKSASKPKKPKFSFDF